MTFVATWEAVSQAGAVPVPPTSPTDDYCLDPAAAEAAVTPRTRAIMPVHLYGQLADIVALARRRGAARPRASSRTLPGARRRARRPSGRRGRTRRGASASTRARTSARWATRARSSRTTRALAERSARCASTGSAGSTRTTRSAGRRGSTRSRRSCSPQAPAPRRLERRAARGRRAATSRLSRTSATSCCRRPSSGRARVASLRRPHGRSGGARRHLRDGRDRHRPPLPGAAPPHRGVRRLGLRAGAFPVAERLARECLSLPIFPGITEAQVERVVEAVTCVVRPWLTRPRTTRRSRLLDDVEFGEGVVVHSFTNLYGCPIGDDTRIGPFVEIQRGAVDRRALQDPEPHVRLRRRDDRGRGLRRPRGDVRQRQVPARDDDDGELQRHGRLGAARRRSSSAARRSAPARSCSAACGSARTRWSARAPS